MPSRKTNGGISRRKHTNKVKREHVPIGCLFHTCFFCVVLVNQHVHLQHIDSRKLPGKKGGVPKGVREGYLKRDEIHGWFSDQFPNLICMRQGVRVAPPPPRWVCVTPTDPPPMGSDAPPSPPVGVGGWGGEANSLPKMI